MSKFLCLFWVVFSLFGCATTANRMPGSIVDDVAPEDSLNSPQSKQLTELLSLLGYEGVGLSYEKPETLQMMYQVFLDPRAKGREIRQIYTAIHSNYDTQNQTLVIDQSADPVAVLAFIEGKVPLRPTIEK